VRVLHNLEEWEQEAKRPSVIASIGNFDGLHLAHQRLIAAIREQAAATGAASLVVSFEPHPARILHPATAPPLITPRDEKLRLLEASGISAVLLLPFSRDLSLLAPREFVERVLVRGLRVRAVHEGENFRFGHRQQGTAALLAAHGREFGFETIVHPAVMVRGAPVSSSRIRRLVASGAVGQARHLLGRRFGLRGYLAPGRGIGHQRTVPTLNLQHYEELLPARGVYLTRVQLEDATYPAVTNVGVRPTFGEGGPVTVESHLLEWRGSAGPEAPAQVGISLGAPMAITFLARIRDERRFESAQALRVQIQRDIAAGQAYFRRIRSTINGGGHRP